MQGRFELTDSEDPECQWTFGQPGELFQYKLLGMHSAASHTAILRVPDELARGSASEVDAFLKGLRAAAPAGAWEAFKARSERLGLGVECVHRHMGHAAEGEHLTQRGVDLLFAGGLVQCESVSVYKKKEGTGLLLLSSYDGL